VGSTLRDLLAAWLWGAAQRGTLRKGATQVIIR
jgi:hypothetical protein